MFQLIDCKLSILLKYEYWNIIYKIYKIIKNIKYIQ